MIQFSKLGVYRQGLPTQIHSLDEIVQEYGHRVRLATHANFRDFVKKEGLEFYPLGGDPKVLAECRFTTESITSCYMFLPALYRMLCGRCPFIYDDIHFLSGEMFLRMLIYYY